MTNLFKPTVVLPSSHMPRQLVLHHVFSGNVLDRKMIPDHPNHLKADGEATTHPPSDIWSESGLISKDTRNFLPVCVMWSGSDFHPTRVTHVVGVVVLCKRAYEWKIFCRWEDVKIYYNNKKPWCHGEVGPPPVCRVRNLCGKAGFSIRLTDTGKSTRKSRRDLRDWWWGLKARALIWKFAFRELAKDEELKNVVFFLVSNVGDNLVPILVTC